MPFSSTRLTRLGYTPLPPGPVPAAPQPPAPLLLLGYHGGQFQNALPPIPSFV